MFKIWLFWAKKYIHVEPKEFFLDFELAAFIGDLLLVLLFRLIFLLLKLLGKFWPLLLPIEVLFTATAQWYIIWVSKIQIYIMKIKATYLIVMSPSRAGSSQSSSWRIFSSARDLFPFSSKSKIGRKRAEIFIFS